MNGNTDMLLNLLMLNDGQNDIDLLTLPEVHWDRMVWPAGVGGRRKRRSLR